MSECEGRWQNTLHAPLLIFGVNTCHLITASMAVDGQSKAGLTVARSSPDLLCLLTSPQYLPREITDQELLV